MAAAPDSPAAALWTSIQAEAGLGALGRVAVLPAVLFVIFVGLFLSRRRRAPEPILAPS
jgi:hypothetical protein